MTFVLDEARLAVPGEDAVEVTVEQWRRIIRSETVVVDGQEITAEDGPFTIKRSPRRAASSVERIADSPMGSPLAGDIPVDPPVSVDVMTRDPMDPKTADAAYIYASLSSSPVLMDLQKSVLEELDGLGAAYDAQEPEYFHITLLYLFKVDNHQLQKLIEAIQFPAAFTVDGVRIGTFQEADDKPVVLMVNPDNALLRIQRELYERALSMGLEISPFSRPSHYKPHVTLAYDLQPPDQKLPRMDAPVRLTVDSIAITRPDYRMARAIRLPQVPGGAAFITRRSIPTAGFFERRERREQTAVARAIGEVRRRLRDFVESLTGRHMGPGDHPSGSPQTVHAGDGAGGSSDHLGQHNERIRSFREKYNGLINEGEELLESMVERGDAERADDLYYDNGIHRLFVSPDGSIYRVDDHGTVAERVLKGHVDELGIEEHGDYVDTFIRLGFARGHAQDYEEGEQGALNVEVTTPVPEAQRRSIRDMVEAGQASGVEISLDANTSETGKVFETEEEIDAVIWTAGDDSFRSIEDFFGIIERHQMEERQSPDQEIGMGDRDRPRLVLPELPPPQPNSIVSLGYTPMTLEWGQFADGAFDFMRLREEALRERHMGPGDHPSGSSQDVHAGNGSGTGSGSGDSGATGGEGEDESVEGADKFEVEQETGPEQRKSFDEALDEVGDAANAHPTHYWSDVYEDVKELHQEAYRLEEEGRRDEAIELRRQIRKKLVFDSLAFAEQTEAWRDTTEEEFAGAFPQVEGVGFDEDAPHEYDAMRMMGNARETAWRVSLERAIHRGDVPYDKEALEARGYYENSDRWVPLEGRDLYHVTTAASAVLDSGLKSRFELSMDHGVGLGGGPDDTISFTADRETARAIELSLHEARMVARNDITARDLVEAAAEGRGAEEPFVDNVLGSLEPGYEPGDYEAGDGLSEVDPRTRERFDGRVVDSIVLGSTLEEYRARNGSEWEPYTEGRYGPIESTTGGTRYNAFVRPMTESEQREFRFRVYKTYSTWRQQAGGRMDPLFFGSNPEALAEVDASEIRTMRYESRPNAMGMQAGALGEIRTPSTEGLEFVEDIEFVESDDADLLAERHLGPGDHPSASPQKIHAGDGKGARGPREGERDAEVDLEQTPVKSFEFEDEDPYIRAAREIHENLLDEDREIIEQYRQMIKDGETTQSLYKDPETGEYESERVELHERIISEMMEGKSPEERPSILMTGGFPGAGKSNVFGFLEDRGESFENYVHIDSDFIKEQLPEYEGWNAALTHQEASDIVDEIVERAASDNLNIIYDATMKTRRNAETLVNLFERGGYDSRVIFVDVPIEEAMRRAVVRTLDPNRGRFVDINYIATHDHKNIGSLEAVKPLVDSWEHWNNDVPFGETPILVESGSKKDQEEEEG